MKLVTLLKGIDSVFIDTAPFIYYIEEYKKYIEAVDPLFSYISQGYITAYTSFITLIEVFAKPIEEKNKGLMNEYEDLLTNSNNLILTDMDRCVAVESAKLRVKYKIKIPDAIQLVSGLVNGAKVFITNDSSLKKIKEIKVIVLDDIIK
ncbi:conserved hypothetical protein [Candidatus Brocadia pituitae]|nr:conserved hypothetical protein [Candidatus Brocadia pituitae]